MVKLRKRLLFAVLVIVVTFSPRPAQCYESDVHFNLTDILCCLAGFSLQDARIIANADQSLDDNVVTSAFPDSLNGKIEHVLWNKLPSYRWHSLADGDEIIGGEKYINGTPIDVVKQHKAKDGREAAQRRMFVLLKEAEAPAGDSDLHGDDGNAIVQEMAHAKYLATPITEKKFLQLVRFGQYLHYYQDSYSHRVPDYNNLNAGDTQDWEPYRERFGHFEDQYNPDRLPWRPNLGKAMAAGCYAEISKYATAVFGYQPMDFTDCSYDRQITTGDHLLANNGEKFTDALIDQFLVSYPALVIPEKNKLAPNLPKEKPYVPGPCQEGKLVIYSLVLMNFTTAKSYQYGTAGDPVTSIAHPSNKRQNELWDAVHSEVLMSEIGPFLIRHKDRYPPFKYDVNGNVNIKDIFLPK